MKQRDCAHTRSHLHKPKQTLFLLPVLSLWPSHFYTQVQASSKRRLFTKTVGCTMTATSSTFYRHYSDHNQCTGFCCLWLIQENDTGIINNADLWGIPYKIFSLLHLKTEQGCKTENHLVVWKLALTGTSSIVDACVKSWVFRFSSSQWFEQKKFPALSVGDSTWNQERHCDKNQYLTDQKVIYLSVA